MDFYVWSILENKACSTHTVDLLKQALQKAWNEITVEEITAIVDNFPERLKACIAAKGGHFENQLK